MTAETLFLDRVTSPLGTLLLVCDREERLRALDFETHESRLQRLLRRQLGEDRFALSAGRAGESLKDAIGAYFAGEVEAVDRVVVRTGGTEFQRRVWTALRSIPAGTATTYLRLAIEVGRPTACRAVGLANGANPIAIVLPCHRVIGSDGGLTGYGGGIDRKRWLLEHERKWAGAAAGGERRARE